MTQLLETVKALGLEAETSLGGRWITLQGDQCQVYVVEADWQSGFMHVVR